MTVPIPGPEPVARECVSCTAPTDGIELCTWCATYAGPPITDSTLTGPGMDTAERDTRNALVLRDASQHARYATEDLADALAELGDTAPLMAVVDVVAAKAHLLAAQRLIDSAATRATEGQEVPW